MKSIAQNSDEVESSKIDLAPWGYAPGSTFFYCTDCDNNQGQNPSLGHRYATRCCTHALEARLKDIRTNELDPVEPVVSCQTNTVLKLIIFGAVAWSAFLAWFHYYILAPK